MRTNVVVAVVLLLVPAVAAADRAPTIFYLSKDGGTYRSGVDYRAICETAAQEVASSFGLDHEHLCEQSSVAQLDDRIGPINQAPGVGIISPADAATAAPGFSVMVEANDGGGVAQVELWIDDVQIGTDPTAPYAFTAPTTLSSGAHVIEARAVDDDGQTSVAAVMITVAGDDGTPGDDPPSGDDPPGIDDEPVGGWDTGGCAAGGNALAGSALLVLALLMAIRRAKR